MPTNLSTKNKNLFSRANLKLQQDEEGKSREATHDGHYSNDYHQQEILRIDNLFSRLIPYGGKQIGH